MKRDLWLKSHTVVCNDDVHYFGKVNNGQLEGTCIMYYPSTSDYVAVENQKNNIFNGLFYSKRKVEGNAFPIIEAGTFVDNKIVGPSFVVIPYNLNDGVYTYSVKFYNYNNNSEFDGPVVTIPSDKSEFIISQFFKDEEKDRYIRFEAGKLILEKFNSNGEMEFVDEIDCGWDFEPVYFKHFVIPHYCAGFGGTTGFKPAFTNYSYINRVHEHYYYGMVEIHGKEAEYVLENNKHIESLPASDHFN